MIMGKKSIVTILGDGGHDHDVLLTGLNEMISKKLSEYEITDIKTDELAAAVDNNPDMIIISKMNTCTNPDGTQGNWLAGELEDKVISYVENGGSLVLWHSGLYGHPVDGKFTQMIGGRFRHRPAGFLNVKYTTVPNTPVTGDVAKEIDLLDEHFLMECNIETANVFLNSLSSEDETPAGWYREYKQGKICCLATPHATKEALSSELNGIITNCLVWCSEK